jgi:uncharacterized RDD family membrane protein YckC
MVAKLASARSRLIAFLLDYLVIAVYVLILSGVISLIFRNWLQPLAGRIFNNPSLFDLFAFLLLILPVGLYFALFECLPGQATLGKRRLGIRVAGADGRRISLGRSLLRSAVKFLPWQVAHTCLFHIPGWPFNPAAFPTWTIVGLAISLSTVVVYIALLVVNPSHRTPYDWVSGTSVVSVPQRAGNFPVLTQIDRPV